MPSEELPTGWVKKVLGDLGRIVTGKTPPTCVSEYFGGEIPFVTPSDMNGRKFIATTKRNLTSQGAEAVKGSRIPAGAIMVSCIGSDMGKVAVAACDCVTNQQINSLIVSGDASASYIFHDLSARRHKLRSLAASGSAQPILNKGDFSRLAITLPPLLEQRSIARVLDALDDKIHLNRRTNQTIENLGRALFAHHFPHEPDDDLPTGWRATRVSEVADINARILGKTDDLSSVEYIEISEVSRGRVGDVAVYDRGSEPSRARRRLHHGDTVMSTVRPERGSYFLCLDPKPNLIASTGFAVISPRTVPWTYLYLALTKPDVFDYLERLAIGAAYPAVHPDRIGEWPLAIPTAGLLLQRFHQITTPLLQQAAANDRESLTLATLRDALLPKLLSGELRVPQAEKLVEATT
jgi:type I restriction enzyme S subunit